MSLNNTASRSAVTAAEIVPVNRITSRACADVAGLVCRDVVFVLFHAFAFSVPMACVVDEITAPPDVFQSICRVIAIAADGFTEHAKM